MYLMRVPKDVPFPVMGTITMKVFRTGAYITVPMGGFRTDFSVIPFEGYAVPRLPMREILFDCTLLLIGPLRFLVGSSIGVIDEINATILIILIVRRVSQYFSLPHLFLPDSGSPVGFLPDSYWISTIFPKRHFHTFFNSLPTGLLLDSYWIPTGLLH
jgi:hypothetical protein